MNHFFKSSLLALLALILVSAPLSAPAATTKPATVKNIILMIPDGMSVTATTLARWYAGHNLAMDEIASGLVRTYSSDAVIADSAPAGSAYATGWKSQTGNVATSGAVYSMPGAQAPAENLRPLATILEAARLAGKSTGIVVTCEFMHATPADFAAHDPSRASYDNLAEQMVYNGLTVILGGGTKYLRTAVRKDGEDLKEIAQGRGYSFVDTTAGLKGFKGGKLFGIFGRKPDSTSLSFDFDRDPAREPSLAEMTTKAIELLSKNKKGFFVMVEGSKIDWAAHANDSVGVISDVLAFDAAVKVALDFARRDKHTLVIVAADHGNSGLTIGNSSTNSGYDKLPLSAVLDPLKKARVTGEGLESYLPADRSDTPAIRAALADNYGIADPSDAELAAVARTKGGGMNATVGPMMGIRARLGYTTTGHTGEDVVLYDYDPRSTRLSGVVDNTDIAHYMARAIGVDLDKTTSRLFVEAVKAFGAKGATISEDSSNPENPILVVVSKDGKNTLKIPRNKSIAFLNDRQVDSEGVTVRSDKKWYVARSLVNLIR
jgi:alkaline phosphatase